MLEAIGLLTSAGAGGIIGLIGTAFKGWQEYKERQADRQHQREMRAFDQEDMRLENELAIKKTEAEANAKAQIANIEGEIAKDLAASQLQAASYGNDKATYANAAIVNKITGFFGNLVRALLAMVDVVRGFMRPGITIYLLVIESLIAYQLYQLLEKLNLISGAEALALLSTIVNSIVFLTATAVTWWFGSRPNQQHR